MEIKKTRCIRDGKSQQQCSPPPTVDLQYNAARMESVLSCTTFGTHSATLGTAWHVDTFKDYRSNYTEVGETTTRLSINLINQIICIALDNEFWAM